MVMPTATPTTITISSAVRPKSLSTSGTRGRSTAYSFFFGSSRSVTGSSVWAVTRVERSLSFHGCQVARLSVAGWRDPRTRQPGTSATSIIPGWFVGLAELVLVLRLSEVTAVDGDQRCVRESVRAYVDVLDDGSTLFVPGGKAVFAGRDIERVVAVRVGEAVVRRRHHVHYGGHVRMDVAIDVDHARRFELVRLAGSLPVQAEIEGVAGGQREQVVRDRILVGEVDRRACRNGHDMRQEGLAAGGHRECRRRTAGGLAGDGIEPDQGLVLDRILAALCEKHHLSTHNRSAELAGEEDAEAGSEETFHRILLRELESVAHGFVLRHGG